MHARVTTIKGKPEDAESGIDNFRANVVPFAREQGKGAILLVNRQSGDALSITLWEDEQTLRASEDAANALRADAADQMGASEAPAVGRYEVAVFEV
jgi:hypothetical protein